MTRAEWLQSLREQAPFALNRVSSTADAQINVDAIHKSAYDQLLASAGDARSRKRGGLGLVLWGDPGVGKSHLLARFEQEVERDEKGLFIQVHNLLVSPRLLPMSLLRCFISPLLVARNEHPCSSLLYGILLTHLKRAIPRPLGRNDALGKNYARDFFLKHFTQSIVPELPAHTRPDAARVAEVLFAYAFAANRVSQATYKSEVVQQLANMDSAGHWLRGDELEPDAWKALNLTPSAAASRESLDPNDQWIETVMLVLLEIARQVDKLVVLCFDQVENLSDERFVELFRFNHALLDHGRNLLIITAGVRSDMLSLRERRIAPEAAWDRLASETIELYFIAPNHAEQLLRARLSPTVEKGRSIPEVAACLDADPLFPLGTLWWRSRVDKLIEVRPRDVISWAHQRWRERLQALQADWDSAAAESLGAGASHSQSDHAGSPHDGASPGAKLAFTEPSSGQEATSGRPPPPPVVREMTSVELERWIDDRVTFKLGEKEAELRRQPGSLPPDPGRLAELIMTTLRRLGSDRDWELLELPPVRGVRAAYDFLLVGKAASNPPERARAIKVGVKVLVTSHATSAAAAYRRLLQDPNPPDHIVVVRDARLPESLGEAGVRYRDELLARTSSTTHVLDIEFGEYAWLSALEAVIGDARSRDLEADLPTGGLRIINEREVEASHRRAQRYTNARIMRHLLAIVSTTHEVAPTGAASKHSSSKDTSVAPV
ncbi:MAG TPA: hypothetical protein PLV92_13510, partial [Pirellulaceae bacterium]|nr:hypothetical protein [Pirellulaceae bacterium]